ncbi:MAG: hypothetical protein M3004_11390 [Bacteroidota bacterium]|nr:hypothetical protein [Bacteroidota bacterium]
MKKYFLLVFVFLSAAAGFAQVKVMTAERQNITQTINTQPKTIAFRLLAFSGLSLSSSNSTVLNVSVKEFDVSNNTRGNTFLVPENGIYHFDVRLNFSFGITDYTNFLRFHLYLLKGSETIEKSTLMNAQTAFTPEHTLMISTTVMLMKGDVISASFSTDANPNTSAINGNSASFSGFKVSDLQNSGQGNDRVR